MADSGVVASSDVITAHLLGAEVVKVSKLDVPVALYVREGRLALGVILQERREHFVPVLFDKVDVLERNVEMLADPLGVGGVLTSIISDLPILQSSFKL